MPHRTYVSDDSTYIVQEVSGEITRQSQVPATIELHEMGKRLGINKFLVDMTNSKNVDTVAENYDFAYVDLRTSPSVSRGVTIAVVTSSDDHSHDFVEVVLSNSGRDARFFKDRNEAIAYLKSR